MKRSKPNATRRVGDPGPPASQSLAEAVRRCRQDQAFLTGLKQIYRQVDAAVERSGATCLGGGACCKFDRTGQRLYASTGELALLTDEPPPDTARLRRGRCGYQIGPRCGARQRRPLGCRVFFCRPGPRWRPTQQYELYHQQIRRLHQSHCLPYAYAELGGAVVQLFAKT